jgi:hypothetical protein
MISCKYQASFPELLFSYSATAVMPKISNAPNVASGSDFKIIFAIALPVFGFIHWRV